nr:casein kinase II subunit alpha-2 isoform X1 [Ipomoea trifida]
MYPCINWKNSYGFRHGKMEDHCRKPWTKFINFENHHLTAPEVGSAFSLLWNPNNVVFLAVIHTLVCMQLTLWTSYFSMITRKGQLQRKLFVKFLC